MYPEEMIKPMRAELNDAGFQDLYSADEVKNAIQSEGTTLVVVNSVCGCAARNARPGAKMSLDSGKKPSKLSAQIILIIDQCIGRTDWTSFYILSLPFSVDNFVKNFFSTTIYEYSRFYKTSKIHTVNLKTSNEINAL